MNTESLLLYLTWLSAAIGVSLVQLCRENPDDYLAEDQEEEVVVDPKSPDIVSVKKEKAPKIVKDQVCALIAVCRHSVGPACIDSRDYFRRIPTPTLTGAHPAMTAVPQMTRTTTILRSASSRRRKYQLECHLSLSVRVCPCV